MGDTFRTWQRGEKASPHQGPELSPGVQGGFFFKQDPFSELHLADRSAKHLAIGHSSPRVPGASLVAATQARPRPQVPAPTPAGPCRSRPHPSSASPARVRLVPAHLPRCRCGRARVPCVPGRSWRPAAGCGLGSEKAPRAREEGPCAATAGAGLAVPRSAGRAAAPSPEAGLLGLMAMGGNRRRQRQRQRQRPAPRAGRRVAHGP